MRCFLALAAAAALLIAGGACGSIIGLPDQGVVVVGCAPLSMPDNPRHCYVTSGCSCTRADAQPGGKCTVDAVLPDGHTPCPKDTGMSCVCPPTLPGVDMSGDFDMGSAPMVECLEPVQVCVGRGVFCGGSGARCLPAGASCSMGSDMAGSAPPQLVAAGGVGPALEPHCQFADDICCPGVDGGVHD